MPTSTRTRSAPHPERITPPAAAALVRLTYPEQFNILRAELEEAYDPATGEAIPMPPALRIRFLTTAQERKLAPAEREAYHAAKSARLAWARGHHMRVPAWGGRATPGGEYRYDAARCRAWYERSLGTA